VKGSASNQRLSRNSKGLFSLMPANPKRRTRSLKIKLRIKHQKTKRKDSWLQSQHRNHHVSW